MKKKTKIIISSIGILLIIGILVILSGIVNAEDTDTGTSIITDCNHIKQNLDEVDTVELGDKNATSWEKWEGAILNQPNIFCIQHGVGINNPAKYNVGEQKQITDPILAYILYQDVEDKFEDRNNPDKKYGIYGSYRREPAQIALWKYLSEVNSTDARDILSGPIDSPVPSNEEYKECPEVLEAGIALYEEAKTHGNHVSTFEPALSLEMTPTGKIKVTVGGNFTSFRIKIAGTEYGPYTKSAANNAWTKEYSVGKGTHSVTLIAEAFEEYNVSYRKLTSADNQRLLVVTGKTSSTKEVSISKSMEISDKVSLQKFILKKNWNWGQSPVDFTSNLQEGDVQQTNSTGNVKQLEMTKRWEKLASTNTLINPKEYLPLNSGNANDKPELIALRNMKYYNPVVIAPGDTITYQICVYNNLLDLKTGSINVQDYLEFLNFEKDGLIGHGAKLTLGTAGSNTDATIENIRAFRSENYGFSNPVEMYKSSNRTFQNYNGTTITCELENNILNIKNIQLHNNTDKSAAIKFLITIKFNEHINSQYTIRNYAKLLDVGSNGYRIMDADYIKIREPELSLQKYISEVNDKSLSDIYDGTNGATKDTTIVNNKTMLGRWAKCASQNTTQFDICSEFEEREIGLVHKDYRNETYYKYKNPVNIEKGDVVTYRIYVYNNSATLSARDVEVKDYLALVNANNTKTYLIGMDKFVIKDVIIKKDDNKGKGYSPAQKLSYQIADGTNIISFEKFDLNAGATALIEVKVQINFEVDSDEYLIRNYSYLTKRNETYRGIDADYVKTKKHSISLEKFVSQVEDYQNQNVTTIRNREGKRYNENASEKSNKNLYKKNNQVEVEVGDIITYTIRLKNTGDYPVKVTKIYDTFMFYDNGDYKLTFVSAEGNGKPIVGNSTYKPITDTNTYDRRLITFENPKLLSKGEFVDVKIKFKLTLNPDLTNKSRNNIFNKAGIVEIQNKNNVDVQDYDGLDNNYDNDYVKTKTYAVSLEKYISGVNNQNLTKLNCTNTTRNGKAEHSYDDDPKTESKTKYNDVVTVANRDTIKYTIKVINNGDTAMYIPFITDTLPSEGVDYKTFKVLSALSCKKYNNKEIKLKAITATCSTDKNARSKVIQLSPVSEDYLLAEGDYLLIKVSVKVTAPNMSVATYTNQAHITDNKIMNRNKCSVIDTTSNDNADQDYFQMKDITIAGTVWNDKALNKEQNHYNGFYDNGEERKLPNIKVYLYRNGVSNPIATTTTDKNGRYKFAVNYIKGPKALGTNRWAGTYYSYYVVFEYDGITYTATTFNEVTSNNALDSNAREKLDSGAFNGIIKNSRVSFNKSIEKLNKEKKINYDTINEAGHTPESKHTYDPNTTAIQSSTKQITFTGKGAASEDQLQHINLGLKGRDIFDLELTNDVYSTKVTVNGQSGVYKYDNKVTLRRSDLSNDYSYSEDMANTYAQGSSYVGESYKQNIRKTDIDVDQTGSGKNGTTKYATTGLKIEVTYKITVQNMSKTDGTATKIIDYFDNKYTLERAYDANGKELKTDPVVKGSDYQSVMITTSGENLTTVKENSNDPDRSKMEIYVVYTLNNASDTLKDLVTGNKVSIATYNMAEINAYTTKCASGQSEYTRGLIDKDSAPESANKEQVRLTSTEGQNTATTNGNPTTVDYYFANNNLENLKYEDDTYASPTLYFVTSQDPNNPDPNNPDPSNPDPSNPDPSNPDPSNPDPSNPDKPTTPEDETGSYARTIVGTVFEDKTKTRPETRIKTGNGKLDSGEVGVYGATVELVEKIGENKEVVRYSVTTGEDGRYAIKGFLPGNYYIRYRYGDTSKTVLLHQGKNGDVDVNKQSYNGEDYQSTNNTGSHGAAKLNATTNFWYLYNEDEGVSTGQDVESRRQKVSEAVTDFTDDKMAILNNMRDMIGSYSEGTLTANKKYNLDKTEIMEIEETKITGIDEIIEATNMESTTPLMLFTVEKKEIVGDTLEDRTTLGNYLIERMNFGIAEVPVTTIDLQKNVQAFTITDSTGNNILARVNRNEDGSWNVSSGDVIAATQGDLDVSIEDEKLQGAKLQITYTISTKLTMEKNFDNKESVVSTITGIVDFIDNDLTYNANIGENSKYWEVTTYEDVKTMFTQDKKGNRPEGTVDPEGKLFTTLVKAKADNPILNNKAGESTATITLEKVLSATDATLEQIITSTIDAYEYSNIVEIIGINYDNTIATKNEIPLRDRVRTPERYIIIPGVQHDSATSEIITIHPPTGDSSISVIYYVLAAASLMILGAGAFCIKKFVLNSKK